MQDEKILNTDENQMDSEEKKINTYKSIITFSAYLCGAFLIAFLFIHFVAQRTTVDGTSMYDTLDDGDELIIEKLSYRFGDVERFDIVVFDIYDAARGGEVRYIKRVIGLPGETVQIKDGLIYIDGEVLEEDYGYYINDIPMNGYNASEEIYIEDGEYFVMGDNRNFSKDSREIGCIKKEDIEGRAFFRMLPLKNFGFIK